MEPPPYRLSELRKGNVCTSQKSPNSSVCLCRSQPHVPRITRQREGRNQRFGPPLIGHLSRVLMPTHSEISNHVGIKKNLVEGDFIEVELSGKDGLTSDW